MGREVKRVALDFEWPLEMLWKGFVNPHRSQQCGACKGSGHNPGTQRVADTFYDFERVGGRWCDDITQDEVQALVDAGRLMDFTHTWDRENGWKPKSPPCVPTADEVNAWNAGPGFGHDAINRWILVEARAKRLGVWGHCPVCNGDGEIWATPEVKALHDGWQSFEPPAGPGYQLWSTTTEGHPMTPVFASPEALADWCVAHRTSIFGHDPAPRETWLRLCGDGAIVMDMVSDSNGLHTGVVLP